MKKIFILLTVVIFTTASVTTAARTLKSTVPAPAPKPEISELVVVDEIEEDDFFEGKTVAPMLIVDEIKEIECVVEKPQTEEIVNMTLVEQKPQFKGGDSEMYKWLGSNIEYPVTAVENNVSGKVVVSFIIEKDGSITNVHVVRSKHPALDAEAVRVVKRMPSWDPALNNGVPVRCQYTLPITFNLNPGTPVK